MSAEQKLDAEVPKLRETLFSKKAHLIIWLKKLFLEQVILIPCYYSTYSMLSTSNYSPTRVRFSSRSIREWRFSERCWSRMESPASMSRGK